MTTITRTTFAPGWDAGARSIASFVEDGGASWQVGQAIGIICGLNNLDESADYREIDHAFFIESGKYRIIENGVVKTTRASYSASAVFKVERRRGVVRYLIDDVLVYTSLTASSGRVFVDCSLYFYLDTIIGLDVYELDFAELRGEFQPITGAMVEAGINVLRGTFEPLTGALTMADSAYLGGEFAPLVGKLLEGGVSTLHGEFQPLTGKFDALTPEYNRLFGYFEPLTGKLLEYYDRNVLQGTFRPLVGKLLEEGVSALRGEFQPLTGTLWTALPNQMVLVWPRWTMSFTGVPTSDAFHEVFYGGFHWRLHQVSYQLGELPGRLHEVSWTSVATKLNTVFYEVTLADSIESSSRLHEVLYEGSGISPLVLDQRLHEVFYSVIGTDSISSASQYHEVFYSVIGADSESSAIRYHEVFYEGSGVSPIVSDQRFHEVFYSVIGADSISSASQFHEVFYSVIGADPESSASQFHEVFYEGSDVSPLVADQRLHEVLYAAVGADPVSSASAFHQVTYSVFVPTRNLHEVFYKVVVLDQRLHTVNWQVDTDTKFSRLHEVRYHVVDTSTIIDAGTITVGDGNLNAYDFLDIVITADEDSPYWQCEMTLKDAKDYVRFPRDAPFVIRLFEVDFNFIVDRRTLSRTIDDAGNYLETCTISGLSPLVARSRPRAARLTQTWTTPQLASSIVEDLIGSVTWSLVDWNIPAYRLAAERADPFAIAQQVVAAPGGLIESQPNGSVVCRHRWPVSIAALDTAVVDQNLDETVIYAASEAPTQDELIDRVRIYDGEAAFQDRLEYVPNPLGTGTDPRNGVLYAFISPWRDGLRIVTTRPSVISIGSASEGTRVIGDANEDYPAEIVTFTERTGSTQYPIMTLTALDWLDENLGAVVSVPYATTLDAGDGAYGGYSLAKVQYVTRYLAVPVRCTETVEEIEAQFLLLENQDG